MNLTEQYRRYEAWDRARALRPRYRWIALAISVTIALAFAVALDSTDAQWPVVPLVLLFCFAIPAGRGAARLLQRRADRR